MRLASDTWDVLSGTWYFLTLDMKSGYWQIELHPSAHEKTAFATLRIFSYAIWAYQFWS